MALQLLGGPVSLMQIPAALSAAPSYSTGATIDAADEAVAFIFRAPETGSITKLGFRTGNVGVGATVDVRLETVDTSTFPAEPTGTLQGTNTNGSQAIANGDDNVWFTVTLTAAASVTKNELLALVIKTPAGGNMTIAGFGDDSTLDSCYTMLQTGVSPAVSWAGNGTGPNCAVTYDVGGTDTYYPIPGVIPSSSLNTSTYNSGSTPDTYGLRFQLPVPARICGCWLWVDADGSADVRLVSTAYNQGAGTGILATASLNLNVRRTNANGIQFLPFDAPYTIAANTDYRLIVEPGGTSLSLHDMTVPTLAHLDALPGGRNFHLTTAKDPTQDSDWTNRNTASFRRPFIGLLIDAFDDGTGGGGSSIYTRAVQGVGI